MDNMKNNYRSWHHSPGIRRTGLFLPILLLSQSVTAATVMLSGSGMDFFYDDTQAGLVHFGAPEVSDAGDSLVFAPADFGAMSVDGIGSHTGTPTDAVDASFTFRAVLHDGGMFESVNGRELGGYRLNGTGFVDYSSVLSIVDTSSILNSTLGEFLSTDDFTIADANYHSWSAISAVDLSADNWSGVGDILVTLTSNLVAASEGSGDSAFIQKTPTGEGILISLLGGSVTPDPSYSKDKKKNKNQDKNRWVYAESAIVLAPAAVPVPAAVWLFGSGLLGLAGVMRRKQA